MSILESEKGGEWRVKIEKARELLNFLEHKTNKRLISKARKMLEIQESLENTKRKIEVVA